jgi:hypothetical protein
MWLDAPPPTGGLHVLAAAGAFSVVWRHRYGDRVHCQIHGLHALAAAGAFRVWTEFTRVDAREDCKLVARKHELQASRRGNQWHPRAQISVEKRANVPGSDCIPKNLLRDFGLHVGESVGGVSAGTGMVCGSGWVRVWVE